MNAALSTHILATGIATELHEIEDHESCLHGRATLLNRIRTDERYALNGPHRPLKVETRVRTPLGLLVGLNRVWRSRVTFSKSSSGARPTATRFDTESASDGTPSRDESSPVGGRNSMGIAPSRSVRSQVLLGSLRFSLFSITRGRARARFPRRGRAIDRWHGAARSEQSGPP
jgi:hypothetical protein